MGASLGPALVAGGVGLIAALLSTTVSLSTIRRAEREQHAVRSQQVALALIPKRLTAYEKCWSELFALERSGSYRDDQVEELVKQSLWLEPNLREALLKMLYKRSLDGTTLSNIRQLLIETSGAIEIDQALRRLTER